MNGGGGGGTTCKLVFNEKVDSSLLLSFFYQSLYVVFWSLITGSLVLLTVPTFLLRLRAPFHILSNAE